MRKTVLIILAGAAVLGPGVMTVAAEAQQQTREPPRIPAASTGPTFPGPQRSAVAAGVPACAPGERPPCHGPVTPRIPGGASAAVAGPPPADEGPGPYDPYPRESARTASGGRVAGRSDPPPGGCVLRPDNPTCGSGGGPAAIGEPTSDSTTTFRFCILQPDPATNADAYRQRPCPFPDAPSSLAAQCTASGGTLAESSGAVGCTLPRARVTEFERSIGRSAARR